MTIFSSIVLAALNSFSALMYCGVRFAGISSGLGSNADAYFRFCDDARALGVEIPIIPGIMPITNSTQLMRFSDSCGTEIPRWIRLRLQSFGDDTASIKAFGLDVVTDLCERLLCGGVPSLHFYTMNQSAPVLALCSCLGLTPTVKASELVVLA